MIGSMDIIGNQWEAEGIRDTAEAYVPEAGLGTMSVRVTSKNTKEDADYEPPFPFTGKLNELTVKIDRPPGLYLPLASQAAR